MSNFTRFCAVPKCKNRSDKQHDIPYHNFPKDEQLCEQWEKAINKNEEEFRNVKRRFVCGEHFVQTEYRRSLTGRRILAPGTIPSVFKTDTTVAF